jgi:hypothetical protein
MVAEPPGVRTHETVTVYTFTDMIVQGHITKFRYFDISYDLFNSDQLTEHELNT